MPITKWQIEPIKLISPTAFGGSNGYKGTELTDAVNASFSSIIVQLSCLAKHAEMMFGELILDSLQLANRTKKLSERVTCLKPHVLQLNPIVEEVSLEQVSVNQPFKSAVDQELALRGRPEAITKQYLNAAPPPALQKLNVFRDDGKDFLKFYTNPDFFFELWCRQIQQEVEQRKKVVRKRQRKKVEDNVQVKAVQKKVHVGVDKEFRPEKPPISAKKPSSSADAAAGKPVSEGSSSQLEKPSANSQNNDSAGVRKNVPLSPTSRLPSVSDEFPPPLSPKPKLPLPGALPNRLAPTPPGIKRLTSEALPTPPPTPMPPKPFLPPPSDDAGDEDGDIPPPPPVIVRRSGVTGRQNRLSRISTPPPPPLSVCLIDDDDRLSTLPEDDMPAPPPGPARGFGAPALPPPPPPPPPPPAPSAAPPAPPPPPPPGDIFAVPPAVPALESGFGLRSAPSASGGPSVKRQETQKRASRGDLLQAIRNGMKLRNVEEQKQRDKEVKPANGSIGFTFDVSKILEIRRQALENDDESENEDDDDWE